MKHELFSDLTNYPYVFKDEFHSSKELNQNRSCLKCVKKDCITFFNEKKEDSYICEKGYNCMKFQLGEESYFFNGLILKTNSIIKKGTKDDKPQYIKDGQTINRFIEKLQNIQTHIEAGIKENIKNNFGLFHDVRSTYAIAFNNLEKYIFTRRGTNFYQKLQDCEKEIIDLYDSLDLVSSLLEMIDIMVNPSSITKEKKYEFNIYRLFYRILKLFNAKADKKNIKLFIHSAGREIIEDYKYHESIKLVPIILLENAIKYSDKNSKITITFDTQSLMSNFLFIHIDSVGKIIKEDERHLIFNEHFRGSNAAEYSKEGLGLGLHIAKKILEIHGFSIEYSYTEIGEHNKGVNRFTVIMNK